MKYIFFISVFISYIYAGSQQYNAPTVLLVGRTQAGKSTFIKTMLSQNCQEQNKLNITTGDDTSSDTQFVTNYTCKWHDGFQFEHNGSKIDEVVFIDTPGLFDAAGNDDQITKYIRDFVKDLDIHLVILVNPQGVMDESMQNLIKSYETLLGIKNPANSIGVIVSKPNVAQMNKKYQKILKACLKKETSFLIRVVEFLTRLTYSQEARELCLYNSFKMAHSMKAQQTFEVLGNFENAFMLPFSKSDADPEIDQTMYLVEKRNLPDVTKEIRDLLIENFKIGGIEKDVKLIVKLPTAHALEQALEKAKNEFRGDLSKFIDNDLKTSIENFYSVTKKKQLDEFWVSKKSFIDELVSPKMMEEIADRVISDNLQGFLTKIQQEMLERVTKILSNEFDKDNEEAKKLVKSMNELNQVKKLDLQGGSISNLADIAATPFKKAIQLTAYIVTFGNVEANVWNQDETQKMVANWILEEFKSQKETVLDKCSNAFKLANLELKRTIKRSKSVFDKKEDIKDEDEKKDKDEKKDEGKVEHNEL